MPVTDLSALHRISQRWSRAVRPTALPGEIKIDRLPKSSYDGDNAYNGFTGAERRRGDQVLQVLRRRGLIDKPTACDLCDAKVRIGYHSEDYFDPCALVRICFPCHMALHARFKSPSKWVAKLDQNAARPLIDDFRALPMREVDFASWLRTNTPGPHDVVKAVWPGKVVQDYSPRVTPIEIQDFQGA